MLIFLNNAILFWSPFTLILKPLFSIQVKLRSINKNICTFMEQFKLNFVMLHLKLQVIDANIINLLSFVLILYW